MNSRIHRGITDASVCVRQRDVIGLVGHYERSRLRMMVSRGLPNGPRLRCGAELERSQIEDHLRKRGAVSFKRLLGSTDSMQLEQRSQEGANGLPRCLCGGCIVTDMWVALDAFVLISEGAVSRSV